MFKRLIFPTLALVAVTMSASTAAAQGSEGQDGTPGGAVISSEISVSAGGYRGPVSRCGYRLWTDVLLQTGTSNRPYLSPVNGVTFAKYLKTCPGARPNPEAPFLLGITVMVPWYPPRTGTPSWLIDAAMNQVSRHVPAPTFVSAPPDQVTYVYLGMWFWTSTPWAPVEATAQVPTPQGQRWATVTATPVALVYHPGDGEFGTGDVQCAGPGKVWLDAYGDELPTECMYTYQHSSVMAENGSSFPASLSIRWNVTWTSWLEAIPQPRGELTTTNVIDGGMQVKEIQAIITR